MIIEGKNLVKKYKNKVVLNNISFEMKPGEVYGILGKNGAGKSTLIKLILGLIHPTAGHIYVLGEKAKSGNSKIGYISENIDLYPHLTAYDHLKISFLMSNIEHTKEDIQQLLEKVGLTSAGKKQTKDFSLGMKRRLQLALAIMDPTVDLLILDEPTNGLDVNGMIWFKQLLNEYKQLNKTIILATHSIKEMEHLITKYFILDQGQIVKAGDWSQNSREIVGSQIRLLPTYIEKCAQLFQEEGITIQSIDEDVITIQSNLTYRELINLLSQHEIYPDKLDVIEKSLESELIEYVKTDAVQV
jgi:ABC-type multidrug transport system ATPase subunit